MFYFLLLSRWHTPGNRPGEPTLELDGFDGPDENRLSHRNLRLCPRPDSKRQTMGKHPRKRQRKDRPAHESVAPLGTATLLDDDADKDDEERRLESLLFGRPFVSGRGRGVAAIEDGEEDKDDDGGADVITAELEGMLDSDVSYHWHFRDSCLTPLQAFFRGRWHNEREEYDRKRH